MTVTSQRIHVLDGLFVESDTGPLGVPEGSKRLVAYCALHPSTTERRRIARALWPDADDARAAGNLRSALWRLRGNGIAVLESDKTRVWRRPGVAVDLEDVQAWMGRLARGHPEHSDLRLMPWCALALDLFPGWYTDWALLARERTRLRMLRALTHLAAALCASGRAALGVEAALLATSHDRLGEDAHRALVAAHLADGNYVMALRAFCRYRDALADELGVAPGPAITALLSTPGAGARPMSRSAHTQRRICPSALQQQG